MRPPFLALTWPDDAAFADRCARASEALRASGWSLALERPGMALWERPARPAAKVSLGDAGPILVGRYNPRAPTARPGAVATSCPAAVARTLCREGWGAYVALIFDPAARRWWTFRDPSGAMEAMTWAAGDLGVLASGLDHVPGALRPSCYGLDWTRIAGFLRDPTSQVAVSGLRGVDLVTPGALRPIGEGPGEPVAVWRPQDWVASSSACDPAWVDRLAETVASTIAQQLEPYGRVVTELSGGLDSAIVNAGLARAGLGERVAAALHYVGDRRDADERPWAEALADQWRLPLRCAALGRGGFDPESDFAELTRDARPPWAALDADRDRSSAAVLVAHGAQALVTGQGGDAMFYQMPSPLVLADLWRQQGPSPLWRDRSAQLARRLRRSTWSVWREAFARDAARAPGSAGDHPPHPWLADLETVPPGKRLQIEALVRAQVSIGPQRCGAVADLVQPLLAQPVVELCLSIPSWELARGDRDRGLAREAFASWLPPALAARRSKGTLTSHYCRRLAASGDTLRPYLLEGVLADAGLVDRDAICAALDPDALMRRADGLELMSVAALECWVRYWQGQVPDVAAAPRRQPAVDPW